MTDRSRQSSPRRASERAGDGAATWVDLVVAWTAWLRAGGSPYTTIRVQTNYITRLGIDHPRRDLRTLTTTDLVTWTARQTWTPNTRKSARSALRGFYGWLVTTRVIATSPAADLPTIRIPRSQPHPASEDSVARALSTADQRVRLAILLGAQCGLRRGEIAGLRTGDVERTHTGYSLRIKGKGGHVRMVPAPDSLAAALAALPPGWVFPSPHGGHLGPAHLARLVSAQLPKGWTTHSLRHRCATQAYAATRDLRAVQELLGHSKPETTANYVRLPDDAVRLAMMAAAELPRSTAGEPRDPSKMLTGLEAPPASAGADR